jgi:hypothetical protein
MKNKYFFARFWQLTMVLTILTQFLVIFISKTRGLVLKNFFIFLPMTLTHHHQLPVFFCTNNFQTPCIEKKLGQICQSYDVINIFFKWEATIPINYLIELLFLDYKNLV